MNKNMLFKTSEDIIQELVDIAEKHTEDQNVMVYLAEFMAYVETNYKRIRGINKKKMVLDAMLVILKKSVKDEDEIKDVMEGLDQTIDCIVTVANTQLFKKSVKRCRGFCRS